MEGFSGEAAEELDGTKDIKLKHSEWYLALMALTCEESGAASGMAQRHGESSRRAGIMRSRYGTTRVPRSEQNTQVADCIFCIGVAFLLPLNLRCGRRSCRSSRRCLNSGTWMARMSFPWAFLLRTCLPLGVLVVQTFHTSVLKLSVPRV